MKFDAASLSFTLINLSNLQMDVQRAGEEAMRAAGEVLLRECKKAIGLRDHSQTDFDRWPIPGHHPYARKHGSIRVHTSTPWQVHRKPSPLNPKHHNQTDTLYRATKGAFYSASGRPVYEVFMDLNEAPHAKWVVGGTKLMLPRDPLWVTANDPKVRKLIMLGIIRRLGKELRTKLGIRFGSMPATSTRTVTGFGGNTGSAGVR